MASKNHQKEQAKALYMQRLPDGKIAKQVGVTRQTIINWKKAGEWEKLRDSVDLGPQKPKLVSFESQRRHHRDRPNLTFEPGQYDTLEGQIRAIDELLDNARREAANPASPQTYGAAVSGFCKLIDQRRSLKPVSNEELLQIVLGRFRSPAELVGELRKLGWGKSA